MSSWSSWELSTGSAKIVITDFYRDKLFLSTGSMSTGSENPELLVSIKWSITDMIAFSPGNDVM